MYQCNVVAKGKIHDSGESVMDRRTDACTVPLQVRQWSESTETWSKLATMVEKKHRSVHIHDTDWHP